MAETAYKRCTRCGETKPLEDFHRDRRRRDGRRARCKKCRPGWQNATVDPERRRAADRRRYERNRDQVNERRRHWKQENRDRVAESDKRQHARHPEKRRARNVLNSAIARGELAKPDACASCRTVTSSRQLHGHHEDYSKPLDVAWLCVACHATLHKAAA